MIDWKPTKKTVIGMNSAKRRITVNFASYLDRFDQAVRENRTFRGPSLYFHYTCIKESRHKSLAQKLMDERFLELLYATLASWGMHRMGRGGSKLVDFSYFRKTVRGTRKQLTPLEPLKITNLSPAVANDVATKIGTVLDSIQVSESATQLVAGTKTVHHLLPNLIPPIDRRYTLRAFRLSEQLPTGKSPSSIFYRLFPLLADIARDAPLSEHVKRISLGRIGLDTSASKVLDNAIVGSELRKQ